MKPAPLRGGIITVARSLTACLVMAAPVAIALAVGGSPARAQVGGELCLSADPPPVSAPAHPLRFGITPLAAGSAGATQAQPKPEDPQAATRELQRLRPGGRQLVLRLNRMLMSDGDAGIHHFASLVDAYARDGFDSELQVRYHPASGQEGDMAAWSRYVRSAVDVLGRRPSVKALTITNEVNFPISPNTSDGSYAGALEAIVVGVTEARRALDRIGRPDVALGFSFAWRWIPTVGRGLLAPARRSWRRRSFGERWTTWASSSIRASSIRPPQRRPRPETTRSRRSPCCAIATCPRRGLTGTSTSG